MLSLNQKTSAFSFCYPYGSYNKTTLQLLKKNGFEIGFTTELGLSDLNRTYPLELLRLDTNDVPHHKEAVPGKWTELILNQQEFTC